MKCCLLLLSVITLLSSNSIASSKNRGAVKLATSSFALEYCNCIFIMEMSAKYCNVYIFNETPLPSILFGVVESETGALVSSRLLLNTVNSTAKFNKELKTCNITNF
jgi:hypothetical protein